MKNKYSIEIEDRKGILRVVITDWGNYEHIAINCDTALVLWDYIVRVIGEREQKKRELIANFIPADTSLE